MCDYNNQLHLECSVVAKYCKLKTKKKPFYYMFLVAKHTKYTLSCSLFDLPHNAMIMAKATVAGLSKR